MFKMKKTKKKIQDTEPELYAAPTDSLRRPRKLWKISENIYPASALSRYLQSTFTRKILFSAGRPGSGRRA